MPSFSYSNPFLVVVLENISFFFLSLYCCLEVTLDYLKGGERMILKFAFDLV